MKLTNTNEVGLCDVDYDLITEALQICPGCNQLTIVQCHHNDEFDPERYEFICQDCNHSWAIIRDCNVLQYCNLNF